MGQIPIDCRKHNGRFQKSPRGLAKVNFAGATTICFHAVPIFLPRAENGAETHNKEKPATIPKTPRGLATIKSATIAPAIGSRFLNFLLDKGLRT